jgi:hypothetical protein
MKCFGVDQEFCTYKQGQYFGGYPTNYGKNVSGYFIFNVNPNYPYHIASLKLPSHRKGRKAVSNATKEVE